MTLEADSSRVLTFARGTRAEFEAMIDAVMQLQLPSAISSIEDIFDQIATAEIVRVMIETAANGYPARVTRAGELSERHREIVDLILAWFQPAGFSVGWYDVDLPEPATLSFLPPECLTGHEAIELRGQAAARLIAFLVSTGLSRSAAEDLVAGGGA